MAAETTQETADSAPPAQAAVYETALPGFPVYRGKVRDVYDLGDRLLLVATDRISAFDVIFPDAIPGKGRVLTQLSKWWFHRTSSLAPNHLISTDVADLPASLHEHRDLLEGRSMLVQKVKAIPFEFVVRGYLDGSAWKQYDYNKMINGQEALAGLRRRSAFGTPLLTPTTKEKSGHDRPVMLDDIARQIGWDLTRQAEQMAISLYLYAHNYLFGRGLVISDTKFEFGLDNEGRLIVIDEMLTPDSSRFWLEPYSVDSREPVSLDKQYVRDYVESIGWKKTPPAPTLPPYVIEQTAERYARALEIITNR